MKKKSLEEFFQKILSKNSLEETSWRNLSKKSLEDSRDFGIPNPTLDCRSPGFKKITQQMLCGNTHTHYTVCTYNLASQRPAPGRKMTFWSYRCVAKKNVGFYLGTSYLWIHNTYFHGYAKEIRNMKAENIFFYQICKFIPSCSMYKRSLVRK